MDIDKIFEFMSNHWMLGTGIFVVSLLLIQEIIDGLTRKYKTITPAKAVILMNDESTLVIDVREPDEFAKGHINGAKMVPYGSLDDKLYELEPHKNDPLIVVCQSGTRSQPACKKLFSLGFTQVHELQGGMLAWLEQRLPISKKK